MNRPCAGKCKAPCENEYPGEDDERIEVMLGHSFDECPSRWCSDEVGHGHDEVHGT